MTPAGVSFFVGMKAIAAAKETFVNKPKLARSSFHFPRRLICNPATKCLIIYMAAEMCPNLRHISAAITNWTP